MHHLSTGHLEPRPGVARRGHAPPNPSQMQSLQAQAEAIASLYQPPSIGRHSDISDAALLKQFLQAIRDGNYLETACDLVGLSKVTVQNWIKRGEAHESPFDRFVIALKEASAQAEAQAVANVRAAGRLPQFWAAEMTYLERRHPDRWGKRQDDTQAPRVVVQIGVGQGEVKVGLALSPPTFAPDSPIEDSAKSLTGNAYAIPSSPITAVMVTNAEACQAQPEGNAARQIPAAESTGGPYPPPVAAGGQRTGSRVKGRSTFKKEKRAVSRGMASEGA